MSQYSDYKITFYFRWRSRTRVIYTNKQKSVHSRMIVSVTSKCCLNICRSDLSRQSHCKESRHTWPSHQTSHVLPSLNLIWAAIETWDVFTKEAHWHRPVRQRVHNKETRGMGDVHLAWGTQSKRRHKISKSCTE